MANLVPRKDFEPGDTLGRTMCFCTTSNNFTQTPDDPYSLSQYPPDHEVAFVYKFDYYNHRLDHHFALHALDTCTTSPTRYPGHHSSPCLQWTKQRRTWCHTFHVADLPPGRIKIHDWKFCYGFRADNFHNKKKRDFFEFFKDRRNLPRKRDWIATKEEVAERCGTVCRDIWGMEMLEDRMGEVFSQVDYFHVLHRLELRLVYKM
ncbi:MAG: hypothetical protein Q9166_004858 [cf. Caloplaca sp. 2 TL-2023]